MSDETCRAPHLDVNVEELRCPLCGGKVSSAFAVKNLDKGGNSLVCRKLHPDDRVYCLTCSYDVPATDVVQPDTKPAEEPIKETGELLGDGSVAPELVKASEMPVYVLRVDIKLGGDDDVAARDWAMRVLSLLDWPGEFGLKLQQIYKDKPPRKVNFNYDEEKAKRGG